MKSKNEKEAIEIENRKWKGKNENLEEGRSGNKNIEDEKA